MNLKAGIGRARRWIRRHTPARNRAAVELAWARLVTARDVPASPPQGKRLRSQPCRQEDFASAAYRYWCAEIKETPRFHRKQWEYVYICQALWQRGLLAADRKGLGFGVGREPLVALFAKYGCEIMATDSKEEMAAAAGWIDTRQYARSIEALNDRGICEAEAFNSRVSKMNLDMNAIPDDLVDYDFCWSACALEHLGCIDAGLRFIVRSLGTLKPGGVAVHTTEFNMSSRDATIESGSTVLFRARDLERLCDSLKSEGHAVEPLDLGAGTEPVDRYVDLPPYAAEPHLKLAMDGFVTTSVGLIIRKGDSRKGD